MSNTKVGERAKERISTRSITAAAMLIAVSVVLQFLEFSIPLIPSFVKLDISDIPALIGSFIMGPLYGVAIEFVKNILHLPFGTSSGVGEICNFLFGAVFVFVAGIVYKKIHTRKGAVLGSVLGALAMAALSLPMNYFFVYPAYVVIFRMPLDAIIDAYEAILAPIADKPTSNSLLNCLIVFNLPFTFLKGILEAAICHVIYKPISRLYHR